jgi:hypothetical protein
MKYSRVITFLFALVACQAGIKNEEPVISPPGYDFSNPVKYLMKEELDEISGIIYMNDPPRIVTLNDEEGKLYTVNLESSEKPGHFKFAKKGDFEDLCFDGQYWYAMKSKGIVFRIKNAFSDSFSVKEFPFPEMGNEFETIFYDPSVKKTIILCKQCLTSVNGRVPAYSLDTTTSTFPYEPMYSPDTLSIMNMLGKKKIKFRPSGAAINPLTGELYILASSDKLLLIMKGGEIMQVIKLSKNLFRQPEGITFAPNGDLYISNEAKDAIGNILLFRYDPTRITTTPRKP